MKDKFYYITSIKISQDEFLSNQIIIFLINCVKHVINKIVINIVTIVIYYIFLHNAIIF